jgi:hypothetical protein
MWFGQEQDARDVVLLGAGFSKAVSCHFPLTKELGEEALDEARVPQKERPEKGTGFEAWLSRIGEDQPYRSVEENLAARGLFVRMSTAIASVMRRRQRSALENAPPAWLDEFLSVLHARQTTVVSFNYDNVIECVVDGHRLKDWSSDGGRDVTSDDIVDRLPPLPPSIVSEKQPIGPNWPCLPNGQPAGLSPLFSQDGDRVARSLRLLKLHGSLSWFWSPDDETGVTLQGWRTPGTFGCPSPDDEEVRRPVLPGRVPFIVPPTATKSRYLTNLVVREIWARARKALAKAERLIVIGYSVPPEDQVASGLLADALRRREVKVIVVDRCAAQVESRLRNLGIGRREVSRFDGSSCVEEFVGWYRDEQAKAVVESLRVWGASTDLEGCGTGGESSERDNLGLQDQVHVYWSRDKFAAPLHLWPLDLNGLEVSAGGKDLRVRLADPNTPPTAEQAQVLLPLLRRLFGARQVRRLVVQDTSGQGFPVVDYTVSQPSSDLQGRIVGPSNDVILVPSGCPRR